jgi:hypothetical protein
VKRKKSACFVAWRLCVPSNRDADRFRRSGFDSDAHNSWF